MRRPACADVAQYIRLALADHPFGYLGHDAQHASVGTRVVGE
jgi:hypothetical protein